MNLMIKDLEHAFDTVPYALIAAIEAETLDSEDQLLAMYLRTTLMVSCGSSIGLNRGLGLPQGLPHSPSFFVLCITLTQH